MALLFFFNAYAQTDSSKVVASKHQLPNFTYYRIGVDLSKFLSSAISSSYNMMEFSIDANYKTNLLVSTEFGFGNSTVKNEYLSYKSSNAFVRLGLDKTLFNQEFKGDLDNAFVGLRYGLGFVNRGAADYTIYNSIYGKTTGIVDANNFIAHWLELTGGFKMEFKKNLFLGWNIRLKTFLNPKKFEQLPPSYVAGYGKADVNTAFGYNFYILYGLGKRSN